MKTMLKEYKDWLLYELKTELKKKKCTQNYMMVSGILGAIHNIDEILEDDIPEAIMEHKDYSVTEQAVYHNKEKHEFTPQVAHEWVNSMYSMVDGKKFTGEKWNIDQTTSVAEQLGVKFEHITKYCWYATMNMMWHDYRKTAIEFGIAEPEFCASLSKGFLFDDDGGRPKDKITAYYYDVVK